jgi:outer membrane protein assembly factor BamB
VRNGVVYLSCTSNGSRDTGSTVDALRVSDGSHLWRYSIDPQALQVAVGDAMVYVFKNGGTLHGIVALDANRGSQRWFYAADHLFALVVGS